MGCAASVDDTSPAEGTKRISVRSHAYDADGHPAVATAEKPLHAGSSFDAYAAPDDPNYDAVIDYEQYANRHSAASDGGHAEEPSAFSRSVSESVAVVAARFRHGITGDPDQFHPGAESASSVAHSVHKAEQWLALGGTPATATSGSAGELGLGPLLESRPQRPISSASADVAATADGNDAVDDDDDDTPHSVELLELQPSFSSPGLGQTMGGATVDSLVDVLGTPSPSRRLPQSAFGAGTSSAQARASAHALKIFSPQSMNRGRCAPTTGAPSRTRSIGDLRSASSSELVRSMSMSGSATLSRSALAAHNARTALAAAPRNPEATDDEE